MSDVDADDGLAASEALVIPWDIREMYEPHVDRVEREHLRKLRFPTLGLEFLLRSARAVVKEVPGEFWALDVEGDSSIAAVTCVCGEVPHVRVGLTETCACGRVFWFAFDRLVAVRIEGPKHDPPTPAES
jgi:hypothetical protein